MLLFNFIISLGCLWIILRINSLFIQPARWNKNRFKLFKLRDELAILAMSGQISEKSDEYITLMTLLNSSVHETSKFRTVPFLRFLQKVRKSNKVDDLVDNVLKKCASENNDYIVILNGYYSVMHRMFRRQTKYFFLVIPQLLNILLFLKIMARVTRALSDKLDQLKQLDSDIKRKQERTLVTARVTI